MRTLSRVLLGSAAGVSVLVASASASAYTFSEDCAPLTEHTLGTGAPNVLMIIDASASMNTVLQSGYSRWDEANLAVSEIVNDLQVPGECPMPTSPSCDPVRFGYGYFYGDSGVWVAPGEDNAGAISSAPWATAPGGGGTQTHLAVGELLDSTELQDTSRARAGIIITDGSPELSAAPAAVERLCELRTRGSAPSVTYMVGFGDESNQPVNAFMAAAGGTGSCTDSGGNDVDPCSLSSADLDDAFVNDGSGRANLSSEYTCTGSLEVTDGESFKSELLALVGAYQCTFPLEIPEDYPQGSALEDPEGTWVEASHVLFGDVRLPFCDEDDTDCGLEDSLLNLGVDPTDAATYADDGWRWADSARTAVTVSDGLCDDIGASDVDTLYTQVACQCVLTGEDCLITLPGFTNEQLERMRCSEGTYECIDGVDECVAASDDNALPEICNGIDDDCDGTVDNLAGTEDQWDPYPSAEPEGKHCNYADVCQCDEGGADEMSEKTGDAAADIAAHLDTWTGVCTCGEGLGGEPEPYTVGEPASPNSDGGHACAVGSPADAGAGGALLLGLLGLLGFARLRR